MWLFKERSSHSQVIAPNNLGENPWHHLAYTGCWLMPMILYNFETNKVLVLKDLLKQNKNNGSHALLTF
jgi:hypothetical protein